MRIEADGEHIIMLILSVKRRLCATLKLNPLNDDIFGTDFEFRMLAKHFSWKPKIHSYFQSIWDFRKITVEKRPCLNESIEMITDWTWKQTLYSVIQDHRFRNRLVRFWSQLQLFITCVMDNFYHIFKTEIDAMPYTNDNRNENKRTLLWWWKLLAFVKHTMGNQMLRSGDIASRCNIPHMSSIWLALHHDSNALA